MMEAEPRVRAAFIEAGGQHALVSAARGFARSQDVTRCVLRAIDVAARTSERAPGAAARRHAIIDAGGRRMLDALWHAHRWRVPQTVLMRARDSLEATDG